MYDAILVGARCAGAPTAMLLARKGYRVLLVDRASFPSDVLMSTHLVWQPGVERLQRWGLLGSVAASNCPPLSTVSLDLGPFSLTGSPASTRRGARKAAQTSARRSVIRLALKASHAPYRSKRLS